MAVNNINVVSVTGNLTKDPELKETTNGKQVCELRMACNSSFRRGDEWESKANYFQVIVWGKQAVNVDKFLAKGSAIGVEGRLEWQSWESKEGGLNSRVVIVSNNIQFLGGKGEPTQKDTGSDSAKVDTSDFDGSDDDIPF